MDMQMNTYANVRGYKIDFSTNTVKVNHKFAKASAQVGTLEFEVAEIIRQKFPAMRFVEVSGRKNKTCHHDKYLTYEFMAEYISVQDNAAEMMAIFEIKKIEAKAQPSRYAYVREWFIRQFPDYRDAYPFKEVS